jgi:hypothetical protein
MRTHTHPYDYQRRLPRPSEHERQVATRLDELFALLIEGKISKEEFKRRLEEPLPAAAHPTTADNDDVDFTEEQ